MAEMATTSCTTDRQNYEWPVGRKIRMSPSKWDSEPLAASWSSSQSCAVQSNFLPRCERVGGSQQSASASYSGRPLTTLRTQCSLEWGQAKKPTGRGKAAIEQYPAAAIGEDNVCFVRGVQCGSATNKRARRKWRTSATGYVDSKSILSRIISPSKSDGTLKPSRRIPVQGEI